MASSKELPPLTESFFQIFVHNQFRAVTQWPPASTDLSGKVAIITGANTGLGYEAARQMLELKLSTLIIAVRSIDKGKRAAERLQKSHPSANIEVWHLDMAEYDSIRAFANRADTLARLDIAVLNAGLINMKFKVAASTQHEEVFQVNYLSTALLAILLLPVLKNKSPPGSPGRLTLVNAALSLVAKFENSKERPLLPSFDEPKNFESQDRYNTSKMLCHMFLWKLAEYVSADDVIVNLADPAWVKGTDLSRDAPFLVKPIIRCIAAFAGRTVQVGASTYLDAAIVKGKESHGCFLMSWKIEPFHTMLYTPEGKEVTEQLWAETLKDFDFADAKRIVESLNKSS